MKHLTENLKTKIYTNALYDFYFKDSRVGVLDIETTGLNPSVNKFVLGGLYNCQDMVLHQFFAEKRAEESAALLSFVKEVHSLDLVITYNGRHFDMPFIEKRMKALFGSCLQLPYNLDLYLVLNGHSPIKKLVPNL
ncbi:MAG: hypothetical protein GX663_02320, partial [Clostridiales bacterium]|nr:hypothetical protein [Clostridiales bacterium]